MTLSLVLKSSLDKNEKCMRDLTSNVISSEKLTFNKSGNFSIIKKYLTLRFMIIMIKYRGMNIRILLQKMFHPIVGYKTIVNASIHYNKKVICFYCMYYVRYCKIVSIHKVGIIILCPLMINMIRSTSQKGCTQQL